MTRCSAVFLMLATLLGWADEAADRLTAAGIAEFTAAYRAWDGQRFAAAAEICRQATTNGTASCANFYWLGVAHFHHLLQLQNQPAPRSDTRSAPAILDAALAALNAAVRLDAGHAESHALLGTLYGMKIDGNLIRGARFGPRVAEHRKKALALGANNPRVQYLLGTCQFHTAKRTSQEREALATFLRAEQLFEAEARTRVGPLEPRWGQDTCLTFIGRTFERLGERARAADYFLKALALRPQDHLARAGLERVTAAK